MAWDDFTEWKDGQPIFVDGDPDFTEWKDGEPLTGPSSGNIELVIAEGIHLHFADDFVLNELVIEDAYHLHVPDTVGWYFATDFSEYTTGLALSDWTERWTTSNFSNTVEASSWAYKLGKELHLDSDDITRKLLSWDDFDGYDNEDIDILTLFKADGLAGNGLRLIVRGSGGIATETAYSCSIRDINLILFRYVAGASTVIKETDANFYDDAYYWLRFRVVGSSLKVKAWSYDAHEPYDWDIEETDTNITGNGWAGLGVLVSADPYVYYFAATLGGTASPEIPVSYTGIWRFGCNAPFNPTTDSRVSLTRIQGGIFVSETAQYVTGASIYCKASHTEQVRMAVYSGGDLSTGPDGAELLVDLGETSGSETTAWIDIACSPVLIPQGKPLWLAIKADGSGFEFIATLNEIDGGGFQNAKGRYSSVAVDNDESVAYPDPWPSDTGTFGAFWYGMYIVISEGVTELAIAGDYLEHYADNTTLNLLSIDDAYHVHAADNVDLLADLVIPDGYLDVVTDPVSLTQEHELAVALDNFHLHDADAPDLYFTLAIPDAFHLHDADTSDLTAPVNLLLHDTVHSVYNDDPILQFDAVNVSWGDQRTGSGGIIFQSHTHYCGNNVLWPGCKVKLNRFYIHIDGIHDIQRRLAVYQGADTIQSADAGASESDLIADFGLTSGSDIDQWIYVDAPSDTYLNNSHECVWLVTKADDSSTHITIRTDLEGSQYDYDFGKIGGHGTTAKVTDDTGTPALDAEENVAFPSTFPLLPDLGDDPGVHSSGGYSLCMYLTLTVTSNTNLIVKPGICEHFADNISALTEIEYMGIQDAFHLHESDPLPLTQIHDLAVDESYHLLVDDPFPLTMNLLVALDNYHEHFGDQCNVIAAIAVLAADCYHEHIPDALDLIQLHLLTVSACYHIHDGPGIALTQEHDLAISDNHLLHYAQSINLIQGFLLVIPESYHDHISDPCEITLIKNLLVAQGWFEHYTDNIGLIPHLAIPEAVHEHFSDVLDLSLHLTLAEASHEIVTDALPLAQDHALAVQEAYHEHIADLANLVEIGALVVDSAFHLQTCDLVPLTVHLTVQEAYHVHYIDAIPLIMSLAMADGYHVLDDDFIEFEQIHYLEIAGTGHNTFTNYHVVTSDEIDWGYLVADLGHLYLVNKTPDRAFEIRTPLTSLKQIQDQRDIENITVYRTLRKAA